MARKLRFWETGIELLYITHTLRYSTDAGETERRELINKTKLQNYKA